MGFFSKLTNWVRGRGFKDNQEIQAQETQLAEVKESFERAEEQQYSEPVVQSDVPKQVFDTEYEKPKLKEVSKTKVSDDEFSRAVNVISNQKGIEEFEGSFNNKVVNNVELSPNMSLGELKPYYTKLFTENAKLNDPDILNILVENRHLLKHRFHAEIKIYSKGKLAGIVSLTGVLLENTKDVYNFVNVGQEIDKTSFASVMNSIKSYFESQYGAIGANSSIFSQNKVTIDDIRINMSYA